MSRYKQLYDGVSFIHPLDHILVFQCCDCGLVHNINIDYHSKDAVKMSMTKNERRTKAVRAARKRADGREKARTKTRRVGPKAVKTKNSSKGGPSTTSR